MEERKKEKRDLWGAELIEQANAGKKRTEIALGVSLIANAILAVAVAVLAQR